MSEIEPPKNPLFPDDKQPSTRSIRMRLVVLVLLILGIASLLSSPFFKQHSAVDNAVADAIKEQVEAVSAKDQDFRRKEAVFDAAGGMNIAGLTSTEILEKRLQLGGAALIANEELIATGDAAGDKLQRKLAAQGAPPDVLAKMINDFDTMYWSPRKNLSRVAGGRFRAYCELLRVLRDRWGQWTYDAAMREPKFDSPDGEKEFHAIQAEVHRAIEEVRNTK